MAEAKRLDKAQLVQHFQNVSDWYWKSLHACFELLLGYPGSFLLCSAVGSWGPSSSRGPCGARGWTISRSSMATLVNSINSKLGTEQLDLQALSRDSHTTMRTVLHTAQLVPIISICDRDIFHICVRGRHSHQIDVCIRREPEQEMSDVLEFTQGETRGDGSYPSDTARAKKTRKLTRSRAEGLAALNQVCPLLCVPPLQFHHLQNTPCAQASFTEDRRKTKQSCLVQRAIQYDFN